MLFQDAAFPDAKEQVRQSTDIVELIGKHLELRRAGRGYVGRCPWHDDRRPSLQVSFSGPRRRRAFSRTSSSCSAHARCRS